MADRCLPSHLYVRGNFLSKINKATHVNIRKNEVVFLWGEETEQSIPKEKAARFDGSIASFVRESVEHGVISCNNGCLLPEAATTLAQMAQALYNLLRKISTDI